MIVLGIGIGEMLVIAGVALVVIGPEKFPDFAKVVVRTMRDLRGYVDDVKHEVNKELKPVQRELRDLSKHKPEDYIDALAGEGKHKSVPSSAGDASSDLDEVVSRGYAPEGEQVEQYNHLAEEDVHPDEYFQDEDEGGPPEDDAAGDAAPEGEIADATASEDAGDDDASDTLTVDDLDDIEPPPRLDG